MSSSTPPLSFDEASLLIADRVKCRRLLIDIDRRKKQGKPVEQLQEKFAALVESSTATVQQRRNNIPLISFPDSLPIAQKRDDIAAAIRDNPVVIVAGETGSGKTTQLPKICLELGYGVNGLIGHTQPRRIAARTVANRIAEELNTPLGELVGYQVRFTDHSNQNTAVKLMTDGILLAEIQRDRWLNRYDTIIIDEAHERSLNIDFLLGYLKDLLRRRSDLKVIVTSATIDVERLSQHFNNAPIVQVSGRTYPVAVNYRPALEEDDQVSAILNTVDEILTLDQKKQSGDRDILVFLAGERDIRETALALRKAQFPHLEVVPLYARLSIAEQAKVFQSHTGTRIVLATNVAETSITVPGIRYVIDPGYARISRYSFRTKVQRLPIEAISQASANQRKGRSGRVSDGVCYRLYSEEDFNGRPEFTEPEILRSNLASVILQMAQLGLGEIRAFPFVEQPDKRLINDGYKLLEELQALDSDGRLTELGKKITPFSIDPRFARMCVAAAELGCLREILIITSVATLQDPRERPVEKQQAADQSHRRFWQDNSDYLAFLNLWDYAEEKRQELSQNQFRSLCKKEFLSFLRLREWRDLHHQLRVTAKQLGLKESKEKADYTAVHRALLTGLLGNIGMLTEEHIYLGPRNRKFSVFPGSSLFKKPPKWIMAGEMLETTKLYAHNVAKIEPDWLLLAAEHLVKRQHSEPHYESSRGQVMAFERITLYGLVLAERRKVNFGEIDPILARQVFIRAALVEGQYKPPKQVLKGKGEGSGKEKVDFWQHNQALFEELEELEAKSRRRDILVEERLIFDFFDQRVPEDIVNLKGFEYWRKTAENETPDLLCLPRELLMQHSAVDVTQAQFPNELVVGQHSYPLTYQFEPGTDHDGVNIQVPIHQLHLLSEQQLDWLVPGMLREKCVQLVKGLPKKWRRSFVPVPATVDKIFSQPVTADKSLTLWLSQQLTRLTSITVPEAEWRQVTVDAYYRFNIQVLDDNNKVIDSGRDINELRERYRSRLQTTIREVGDSFERSNIERWDFDKLPVTHQLQKKGVATLGYPTLVDNGTSVGLRLLDDPEQAEFQLMRGVARLILLELNQSVKYLQKNLLKLKNSALRLACFGKTDQLLDDLLCAAIKHAALLDQPLPRDTDSFNQRVKQAKEKLIPMAQELEKLVFTIGDTVISIHAAINARQSKPLFKNIAADLTQQLKHLTPMGFLFHTRLEWLRQYPRYLQGISVRIEKSDAQIQKDLNSLTDLKSLLATLDDHWPEEGDWELFGHEAAETYRWMLEEYRLSLFAQPMKTKMPVSPKRLEKQWELVKPLLDDLG